MAAVLGGTLALQWPLGWLSDQVSRNLVIAGAALASAASAIAVAMAAVKRAEERLQHAEEGVEDAKNTLAVERIKLMKAKEWGWHAESHFLRDFFSKIENSAFPYGIHRGGVFC